VLRTGMKADCHMVGQEPLAFKSTYTVRGRQVPCPTPCSVGRGIGHSLGSSKTCFLSAKQGSSCIVTTRG